ncbi:MAG: hypothetical protein LIO93_12890 [Bacteroidales bacterium]|nr:hypothetical protein [Bacteroidales bacterium]
MRVLIYYSKLNVGGAERSNVRMMKKMVNSGWGVTLLLRYGGGTMESEIPAGVQVLYLRRNSDFLSHISQNSVITKAKGYIGFLIERLHEERTKQQVRKEDFDIAIIGLQGLDAGFVVNNIKAKKTLLWIRNDLHGCDPTGKVASNIRKYAEKIDYFPCVSQTAKQSFEDLFPALREKAVLIYNVLDTEEMLKLAAKPSCIDNKYADKLKILSVCRVSDKVKGIFRMLDVYEKLRNEGIFFYWILAGNGEDYQELQKRIMQKNCRMVLFC